MAWKPLKPNSKLDQKAEVKNIKQQVDEEEEVEEEAEEDEEEMQQPQQSGLTMTLDEALDLIVLHSQRSAEIVQHIRSMR